MPKIFLTRDITVNLSTDSKDSVQLRAGLQDVDKELAEHWFVQANSQAIEDVVTDDASSQIIAALTTDNEQHKADLEKAAEKALDDAKQLQASIDKAAKLEADLKAKDLQITQLTKQLQEAQAPVAAKAKA